MELRDFDPKILQYHGRYILPVDIQKAPIAPCWPKESFGLARSDKRLPAHFQEAQLVPPRAVEVTFRPPYVPSFRFRGLESFVAGRPLSENYPVRWQRAGWFHLELWPNVQRRFLENIRHVLPGQSPTWGKRIAARKNESGPVDSTIFRVQGRRRTSYSPTRERPFLHTLGAVPRCPWP